MLILFETPAGYALFKANEKKLAKVDNIFDEFFSTPEKAQDFVKLKAFYKFQNTSEALAATAALVESKMGSVLKAFIKKNIVKKELSDELGVADKVLGGAIKDKFGIAVVADGKVAELMRGIRYQMTSLIDGLEEAQLRAMQLGLGHTLSRYKLKFSPDKVDTMIVQAIGLLDDLDKEINTYAMRVKEWYGWHFPEMQKVVVDNLQYAQAVFKMRNRVAAATTDFSDIMPSEVEDSLKESAVVSMGTDISPEDEASICALAEQVVGLMEYRRQLWEYLQNRMAAIAPNLTMMVGELVGARLIAHAGSLMNLAKAPASTVQILGAEKALFRALKTKHDTPKYGLIYHASLIGQAPAKAKGKISRVLAAKTALSIRVDALGDSSEPTIAIEARAKVEARLRVLEGGSSGGARLGAAAGASGTKARRVDGGTLAPSAAIASTAASKPAYNPASDLQLHGAAASEKSSKKRKADVADADDDAPPKAKKEKKEKKEKKAKREKAPVEDSDA